jgi:hypothetical protein
MYITDQDIIKSIIAVINPHDATTKGNESIPAPIVVPIIRSTLPRIFEGILNIMIAVFIHRIL